MTRFIKSSVGVDDHVIGYFKRDVPCFQFTGFQVEDNAGRAELTQLLSAIEQVADWAENNCIGLSGRYPAHHELKSQSVLELNGKIMIQINHVQHRTEETANGLQVSVEPMSYITLVNGVAIVPAVWYNEGSTQVKWGRLEAAVREALTKF